jgi:Transposase DDE domain/Domain of unknown function (DUF4372)
MIPNSAPFGRRLFRQVQPLIEEVTHKHQADRYRKKFRATSHIWLLAMHVASGSGSLRQTHTRFGAQPQLRRRLGLPEWISLSQLARSSTSRSPDALMSLLSRLTTQLRSTPRFASRCTDQEWKQLNRVRAIDSTFLALSAKLSAWSVHGSHTAGARVQCSLDIASRIPQVLCLTTTDTNDHTALWKHDLSGPEWEGWTLIMDLGYYGHRQFERLLAHGVDFLSKLHTQAAYRLVQSRAVEQKQGWTSKDDEVLRDETVVLGSPNNRRGTVIEGMRLITSRNSRGEECRFITSRHDLSAWEVVELYRRRWDIELFFRWLKRQLGAIRPVGYTREALWLTVVIAAVVALLWLLLDAMQPPPVGVSRISWLRAVADALLAVIHLSRSG